MIPHYTDPVKVVRCYDIAYIVQGGIIFFWGGDMETTDSSTLGHKTAMVMF